MESVSREQRQITVDIIQHYLHSRQCSDAPVGPAKGQCGRDVQRRAIISLVH